MPYQVESHCPDCEASDTFIIGLWTQHAGVWICPACEGLRNVSLPGLTCDGCGLTPGPDDYFNHAPCVPYLSGEGAREPGPPCPRCDGGPLTFRCTSHINVGRLGAPIDGAEPWKGIDTPEKLTFLESLFAFAHHYGLDVDELMAYYNLDLPSSVGSEPRLSLPILLDIRAHLFVQAMLGNAAPFTVSDRLREDLANEM